MQTKTKERIYPTKAEIEECLTSIRLVDHIRRYQLIKRYCFGKVVDIACGVGYGSYLLSNNPDITQIIAVDRSDDALNHASENFTSPKISFVKSEINDFACECDTLVSIETIEHIKNVEIYKSMVERCKPSIFIVSFPDKKSTHFNEYHFHDFKEGDLKRIFNGYICAKTIEENDVKLLVFTKLNDNIEKHIFA